MCIRDRLRSVIKNFPIRSVKLNHEKLNVNDNKGMVRTIKKISDPISPNIEDIDKNISLPIKPPKSSRK